MSISLAVLNWNPIQFCENITTSFLKGVLRNFLVNKQNWIYIHRYIDTSSSPKCIACASLINMLNALTWASKCAELVFLVVVEGIPNPGLFKSMHISLQPYASQVHCYISFFCHIIIRQEKLQYHTHEAPVIVKWYREVPTVLQYLEVWPACGILRPETAPVLQTNISGLVWDSRQKQVFQRDIFMYLTWTQTQKVNWIKLFNVISGLYCTKDKL